MVVNHTSKISKLISSHHTQNKSTGSQHAVLRDLSTQEKKPKEKMQMYIFIAMDMHGKPESFLLSSLPFLIEVSKAKSMALSGANTQQTKELCIFTGTGRTKQAIHQPFRVST